MHLLNESIFNNKDYQEKAKQLFQEIKECLWRSGNQKGNSVSIAAYLLYQTSRCKKLNEITFQTVAENSFPIDEDVRVWVRKNMSEEIWLELIKLVSKYSLEIFALTVLLTGEDSYGYDVISKYEQFAAACLCRGSPALPNCLRKQGSACPAWQK